MVRRTRSPWERFFEKIRVAENGCWEWQAGTSPWGYGQFLWPGISTRYAHRIAYMVLVGPIPEGLTLDHLCGNPPCVNPQHLDPCTIGVNVLRSAISPTAKYARQTHCKYGHPLAGANLYVKPNKRERVCRICQYRRVAEFKARNPGYLPPCRRAS